MNARKTKVTIGCTRTDKIEEKGKWPCSVDKTGVGNNSILHTNFQKWVHKRCRP